MPKPSSFKGLTAMEGKFVDAHEGNDTEAAKKAGYKCPHAAAPVLMKRQRVVDALAAKKHKREQIEQEVHRDKIEEITITRNEIVNGLATLARSAEIPPAVRATAYLGLADIFLLRVKNVRDINKFHGWTADELDQYAISGAIPERFRSVLGSSVSPAVSLRTEKV